MHWVVMDYSHITATLWQSPRLTYFTERLINHNIKHEPSIKNTSELTPLYRYCCFPINHTAVNQKELCTGVYYYYLKRIVCGCTIIWASKNCLHRLEIYCPRVNIRIRIMVIIMRHKYFGGRRYMAWKTIDTKKASYNVLRTRSARHFHAGLIIYRLYYSYAYS